jgi:hypothetical protein
MSRAAHRKASRLGIPVQLASGRAQRARRRRAGRAGQGRAREVSWKKHGKTLACHGRIGVADSDQEGASLAATATGTRVSQASKCTEHDSDDVWSLPSCHPSALQLAWRGFASHGPKPGGLELTRQHASRADTLSWTPETSVYQTRRCPHQPRRPLTASSAVAASKRRSRCVAGTLRPSLPNALDMPRQPSRHGRRCSGNVTCMLQHDHCCARCFVTRARSSACCSKCSISAPCVRIISAQTAN